MNQVSDNVLRVSGQILPFKNESTVTVNVYLDDGRVFYYDVDDESKGREHAAAIVEGGYRHTSKDYLEFYPPHRIMKVKLEGHVTTMYPDDVRGT